jgi:hypothetical protein
VVAVSDGLAEPMYDDEDVVFQSHPTLVERMKFSQRFIESLK